MEQPKPGSFSTEGGAAAMSMVEIIALARRALTAMNGSPIDAVAQCEGEDDGSWRVVIDVVESPARMGNNDLLCAYEIRVSPQGKVAGFQRLGRYHREDGSVG
ncbi:hypothetical protein RGUI_4060 [Rhodovulum sp. P5]|uniref:gas vesicle protein GvpO n=1 Tax=Rhodovulum sp. P5 TaxID=1564506 RepID=UPI0009C32E06|nr:gas vesicle protein GvpO [Rhodovulum sp. P5]ARE42201.1 hypothetical protein RGUI_4060 [Rhodovulum sp. P5]